MKSFPLSGKAHSRGSDWLLRIISTFSQCPHSFPNTTLLMSSQRRMSPFVAYAARMILFPVKNRNFEMSHFFVGSRHWLNTPLPHLWKAAVRLQIHRLIWGSRKPVLSCLGNRVIDVFQFYTKCFVF